MYLKGRLKFIPYALLTMFILGASSFTYYHKYYVSVSQVEYSEKDKAIQVTSRLFIDDLEKALLERYELETHLATEKEDPNSDSWIEKYLTNRLKFSIDGVYTKANFIGKKYENDMIVCFLEIEDIDLEKISNIELTNLILLDVFQEQQNITHLRIEDVKKSFVFNSDNNKGMLNL